MSPRESIKVPTEKSKVDLDKLLVEEIGQCGKFQLKIIAQSLIAVVFVACNINDFVFTAARIETRCLIPECESTTNTEFAPSWITNAIPTLDGSVDNCHRYESSSIEADTGVNDTCPATLFDTEVLTRCDHHVYQSSHTVVYDFDLGCDEWRRSMIGSLRTVAMIVALPLTGLVSDRWGRRRALAINASCAAALGLMRYWAPTYLVYVLLMILETIIGLGSFSSAYVLTVELLGPKFRVMGGAMVNSSFAVGQMLLALIAWIAPTWRELLLLQYIPQFLMISFFWTLTESVRWMMSKGKFQEAEDLLKEAARVNGKVLSQKSLEQLRANAQEELSKKENEESVSLIRLVVRQRQLLVRCLVTCTWWAATIFIYYGLSINALALMENKYVSYALVSLVELPGYWSAVLIIDRVGRKPTIITAYWLCAACQLAFIFFSNDTVSQVVYFLGKWCICVVITTMNMYTLELYPTDSRHRFYAFCATIGRFGSIVAPLTPALGATFFPELPFVMFGSLALVAGLLTFLVPETLGRQLPDTMHQAFPSQN